MTRPTLALMTIAAILAAIIGASWLTATPVLGAAGGYVAVVLTLAHAIGAPPARTLGATVLLTCAALALVLRAVRHLIDLALFILGATHTAGAGALRAKATS